MDSFKIVFVKDTFKRENRLSERHFLTKIFIFLKILNESIFQINIKRVMFGPKTKKKNVFFSNFDPFFTYQIALQVTSIPRIYSK
jgi:hypothetical protein